MPTYIRVRDDSTGHEYDVDEGTLRPGMTPIKDYPANSGPSARPRPAKHLTAKDGTPATPRAATSRAVPATAQAEGADQK